MIYADIYSEVLDCCDLPINCIVSFDNSETKEILIGSYTCGNYFLYLLKQLNRCVEKLPRSAKINIVIPALSENQLDKVVELLSEGKASLSEINKLIVNDLGGIELYKSYFLGGSLGLGRILFRQYRDFRYSGYADSVLTVHTSEIDMIKRTIICPESIDIDCIGYNIDLSNIPTDVEVYLHYPLVLSTYGHICEFASVSKEISKKYRPDDICNFECFSCKMRFSNDDMVYLKVGRGIYYPLSSEQNIHIGGHRIKIIYKAKEFCYEDFSSAQRV